MKIRFLGTNGWYDSLTGNTACVLVEVKDRYIILDAGNGLYKIDRYINKNKPVHLFLSHFHLDHIIGLHILNKFNFPQGIDIFGPKGLTKVFKFIINSPYSKPVKDIRTKIRLHELNPDMPESANVEFKKLRHTVDCFGYRFNLDNKVLVYCTDTGVCKNLIELAGGADLLITECSYLPGQTDRSWPHLNPESSARVAKTAKAKKLVLLHFDAALYITFQGRMLAERCAKKIFRNSKAAKDGMIEIL
ncbi:MAG: MBL fold metallo-hydrolase [Candidatus Omnitrophota bacterium]|jgi:ribonuclease BN (tRNA processing enzyme)